MTMKKLREAGRHYWKVEHWNPYAKNAHGSLGIRQQDAFGFIDIIAIDAIEGIVAIQVTSASGHSEHRKKILRNVYAQRWVSFCKIELWSWRKSPKVRGQKLLIWKPKVEVITLEDFKEFANAGSACENICGS
jgi:hypothetical protein